MACDWRNLERAKETSLIWAWAWALQLLLGRVGGSRTSATVQRICNGVIGTSNVSSEDGKVIRGSNNEYGANKVHNQEVTGET